MTTSELEPLPNLAAQPNSPPPTDAGPRQNGASTARASAQLARWSRARALRAGRRLERPAAAGFGVGGAKSDAAAASSTSPSSTASRFVESLDFDSSDDDEEGIGGVVAVVEEGTVDGEESKGGKLIYMVSDGTGSTLEHAVGSALGQFEHLRASRVNTRLFSGINDVSRLLDVIKQAAKEGALLLYTLVDPSMTEPAKQACQLWNVPFVDILEPTTKAIASHLGAAPSGIPRSERKTPLTKGYFRRIEAIEFTIKQDDGALPQNLHQAHIVLLGVSRSGKTPLSIYLAQKGYKVANVPIVMGVDLPKVLFQINQEKVYGLLINPAVLHAIRKSRAKTLGFSGEMGSNYSEMDHVRRELDFASKLYAQNPMWPVIDMTGKAIEEIAAVIVRFYQDRKQKSSMPWISRRY